MFYALNVALIIAGCFLFYKFLLQKETYFPLNRFILLGCLLLAFSLPFIPVPEQWSFRKAGNANTAVEQKLTTASIVNAPTSTPIKTQKTAPEIKPQNSIFKDISIFKVLITTYWLGVIVFGINFLFQLLLLLYRGYKSPFIQDGRFRIVELSGDQAPCSFANNIYINPEKYDWDTYTQIILHEKIHIQQGHSYDIILAELALIFQWFNPFAWFYRKAMEDNLEFLTDNEILETEHIEKTSYQMSLVKVSAPHFPMSLTTNYNQSILKKRLMMMNTKKSNLNSTWKYLCIFPLLLVFISLLNEPVVYGKAATKTTKEPKSNANIDNKGTWFATIKEQKIKIRFENEDDKDSNSNTDFDLSSFKNLPRDGSGEFSLTRDAGTIVFNGRFEGNTGMGSYQFNPDNNFVKFLEKEGVKTNVEKDLMVYFLVNLKKDFVTMLKGQGYANLTKNDLIPLAALNITESYITSLKTAGLSDLSLKDLIPLKALDVDGSYVSDIKKSGYTTITASKLISLKAQNIDGSDIKAARESYKSAPAEQPSNPSTAKIKKTEKANVHNDDDIFGNMIAKKVLSVTPEYIKSFTDLGFKIADEGYIAMKALGITAAYYKSFENAGFKDLNPESIVGLKAIGLTAEEALEYKKLNFKNLEMDEIIGAKATGVTPTFIIAMRKKGHNFTSIDKYISMKVLALDNN